MAEIGNSNDGTKTMSSKFSFLNRSSTTLRNEKPSPPPPQQKQLDRSLTKLPESPRGGGGGGGVVKRLCSFFESAKSSSSENQNKLKTSKSIEKTDSSSAKSLDSPAEIRLPGTEDRIVLYFTSLRGIRRTYEDCYAVRTIFRGYRVWVDERDISMDANYRKELTSVLFGGGEEKNNSNILNSKKGHVTLPQVFIRGRHVGGADVIRHMWEAGELEKVLEGLPRTKGGFFCESCADVRFVPCGNCSGSRKVFDEDEGVMKRCFECNENGLIRCPNCCSY